MEYSAGTRNSTWNVDAARPKARLVTSGISTWAWRLVSVSSGSTPATVVNEVSRMARKRCRAARREAASAVSPARRWILMKATSTMALLTTTPARETNPTRLGMDTSRSRARCPTTTPRRPRGMEAMTTRGST